MLHGGQDDLCSTTCNTPTILTPLVFGESLTANLSMCTCTCTCLLLKSNFSYFFLCGDFHMYLSLSLSLSLSISHATIMKLVVIEWFHNFIQMTWSWAKMAKESWHVQEALALYGAQNLDTLQHTATHCNTLQHTATLYSTCTYTYNQNKTTNTPSFPMFFLISMASYIYICGVFPGFYCNLLRNHINIFLFDVLLDFHGPIYVYLRLSL